MQIQKLKSKEGIEFQGLFILDPEIFGDERGFFYESWNKNVFDLKINAKINFVQDNHSSSIKGVLRGLHYQTNPSPQGKLVRCIKGEVFDVAVDLRRNSMTFGKWFGVNLNSINKLQFWIPEGFAHGFLTISESAEVCYKTTNYWNKDCEKSIRWNDEKLAINWPLNKINKNKPLLSTKDKEAPSFKESYKYFD